MLSATVTATQDARNKLLPAQLHQHAYTRTWPLALVIAGAGANANTTDAAPPVSMQQRGRDGTQPYVTQRANTKTLVYNAAAGVASARAAALQPLTACTRRGTALMHAGSSTHTTNTHAAARRRLQMVYTGVTRYRAAARGRIIICALGRGRSCRTCCSQPRRAKLPLLPLPLLRA